MLKNKITNQQNSIQEFPDVVKIALILNFLMFCIEIGFGFYANSLALVFDATDFLGDSLNYAIAIYVLSKPKRFQSIAALIKAVFMLSFGIYIIANGLYQLGVDSLPKANIMISISILAFVVNFIVSAMLFKFKDVNSNQKSVWLCSRNDAVNNLMTIFAGVLVANFDSKLPDLIVAAIMAFLAISSALQVFKEVKKELENQGS
jgi:Co/Zn/Cd efflux system component